MIQNQWAPLHGETKGTSPLQGREADTRLTSPKLESHFGRLLNSYQERVESESGDGGEGNETRTAGRTETRSEGIDTSESEGSSEESRSKVAVTDPVDHDPESENTDTVIRTGKPETVSDSDSENDGTEGEDPEGSSGDDSGELESSEKPVSVSEQDALPTGEPVEEESGPDDVENEPAETSANGSGSEQPDLNTSTELDSPERARDRESEPQESTDSDGTVTVKESSDSETMDGHRVKTDLNERERTTEYAGRSGSESSEEANSSVSGSNLDPSGEAVRMERDGQRSVENGIAIHDDKPESSRASGKSEDTTRQESEKSSTDGNGTPDQKSGSAAGDSAGSGRGSLSEEKVATTENGIPAGTENRQVGERSIRSEANRNETAAKQRTDHTVRFVATDRTSDSRAESNGSAEVSKRYPAATKGESTSSMSIQEKGAEGNGETPVVRSDEPLTGWLSGHSAEAVEKSIELRNVKAEKIREQRNFKHLNRFSSRGEMGSERSEMGQLAGGRSLTAEGLRSETNPQQEQNLSNPEKEMSPLWQELAPDLKELKEGKVSDSQPFGMMRLGQIPISNLMIRRNLLPGLTQQVVKAAGANSGSSEVWQKHNIEIEQGKNVQISVRKTEGVLQLRLGSSNPELNRLMQQYQHEIRQHLEEECGLEVDLQFDNPEEDTLAQFFDGSAHREGVGSSGGQNPASSGGRDTDRTESGDPVPAIRRFGYNQMEWTI